MTGNVSNAPSTGARRHAKQQFSPPASTLHHDYSNIEQPLPALAAAASEPHLTRNARATSSHRPLGPTSLNRDRFYKTISAEKHFGLSSSIVGK
jgi:hypothetical protein